MASIIYYQNKNFDGSGFPADRMAGEKIPLEARILRILKDLYQWEATGTPRMEAFKRLKMAVGLYDPGILDLSCIRQSKNSLWSEILRIATPMIVSALTTTISF